VQQNNGSPTPHLHDILKMRNQESNTAFQFIVDNILGCVMGKRRWRNDKYAECVMDKVTVSDEAFTYLVIENNWDLIKCKEDAKPNYTRSSHCSNCKNEGWTANGIKRYNELFQLVTANRKEEWARQVETDVKVALFEEKYGEEFPSTVQEAKMKQQLHNKKCQKNSIDDTRPTPVMQLYDDTGIVTKYGQDHDDVSSYSSNL